MSTTLQGKNSPGASVALATFGGGNRCARAAFKLLYIPKSSLPLNIEVPAGVTCDVKPWRAALMRENRCMSKVGTKATLFNSTRTWFP